MPIKLGSFTAVSHQDGETELTDMSWLHRFTPGVVEAFERWLYHQLVTLRSDIKMQVPTDSVISEFHGKVVRDGRCSLILDARLNGLIGGVVIRADRAAPYTPSSGFVFTVTSHT